MELRLLSTESERRTFTDRLVEARQTHGAGFKETEQSLVGKVHLTFGRLYGLYDEDGPEPEKMVAGFVMHNLATFGQSYPKPDLTHLSPKEVVEIGELWAVVAGAARAIRHGCAILTGLLKAKAVLVYPIFKPWNLTAAYKEFSAVGEPIQWPYAETLDGGKILVQPMLLEGAALRQRVQEASSVGFDALRSNSHSLRFDNPFPMGHLAARRMKEVAAPISNIQIPLVRQPAIPPELNFARNGVGHNGYVRNPGELNGYPGTGYNRSGYAQTVETETAVG